ncbi:MAG: protein translocase subunit SecD [Chloroflexi bacterium]|nr:protein translocase subunit SecD [Chloroflexota bacterium]
MKKRDQYLLVFVVIIFALALLIIFPIDKGTLFKKNFQLGLDLKGGSYLLYEADLTKKDPSQTDSQVMSTVVQKIERRVNSYGVTEPIIQIQGNNRILVQLPGVKDISQAIKLIGQVALLEFKEEKFDEQGNVVLDDQGNPEWVIATGVGSDGQVEELTGKYLKPNAALKIDQQTGKPEVAFEWNSEGAILFKQVTTKNLNLPLGIFLDNTLVSAPTVEAVITDQGVINGVTLDEAKTLVIQLNSGSLDVPLKIVQQTDVDGTLGADSLSKSLIAGLVGVACVVFFMVANYRIPGLVATAALCIYMALVLAIFKLIPITLTLPGIAGFVISIGMAVDANVLIFERVKEELRAGFTLDKAVREGFQRAWPSIRDSNVSTFITCIILYWFGGMFGAFMVRGFAVTLFLGVAISMFSAVIITRTLLTFLMHGGLVNRLSIYGVKK